MTDESPELAELRARVGRLERQGRRLKAGVLLLLATATALLLWRGDGARAQPGERLPLLEARQLTIRDAAGRVRLRLGVEKGSPSVFLYHADGGVAGRFFAAEEGSSDLSLFDGGHVRRVKLWVRREGSAFLSFASPPGTNERLGLAATKDVAALALADGQGKTRVSIAAPVRGTPFIALLDAAGNTTWSRK